jgi:ADP-ribosylglycohydrolase
VTYDDVKEDFLDRALSRRAGSAGAFAIAWALLILADTQQETARAVQNLGNGNASTDKGAIENLAMQIVKASERIGDAISAVAQSVGAAE